MQDHWILHFLMMVALLMLLSLSVYVLIGFVWIWWIIRSTNRSGWWCLALFVPLLNAYIAYRSLWRYTSRTIYWTEAVDDPNSRPRTLFTAKWQMPEGLEKASLHGLLWSIQGRPIEAAHPWDATSPTTQTGAGINAPIPQAAAGWYPEPRAEGGKLRYWDGSTWTRRTKG